ncbi:MAG: prephenate dehydrogenase [Clostridia bacterium]|nr:prephenate dehydrogenase [Clostridia bacterium]
MLVGIVGLGLIGGSFAKAYTKAGHDVLACDADPKVVPFAKLSGCAKGELTDDKLKDCDLILICVYPAAAIRFLEEKGALIGKKPVVVDCCGTKRAVVEAGMALAEKHGFTYAGGHPMAGTQFSGFKHARADLYKGAPMVVVPSRFDDVVLLDRIKGLLMPAGFAGISVTTAEEHDRLIAFTSQLAHLVSSAYIKSPTARAHRGFSAGSDKDMTRVAWLNPEMWAELFLDDRDHLIEETDTLIAHLIEYRNALQVGDRDTLVRLLAEGKAIKEEVDG